MEKNCSNLKEIIEQLENIQKDGAKFFFRGENELYENKISSSLFRNQKKDGKKIYSKTLETYFYGQKAFHREIISLNKREDFNFMALCQHHGLPTPLIDITLNPLVAIYFACQPTHNSKDLGVLYCLKKEKYIELPSDLLKYEDNISDFIFNVYPFANLKRLSNAINDHNRFYTNNSFLKNSLKDELSEFQMYLKSFDDHTTTNYMKEIKSFKNDEEMYRYIHENFYKIDDPLCKEYQNFLINSKIIKKRIAFEERKFTDPFLINYPNLYTFILYLSRFMANGSGQFFPDTLNFYVKTSLDWDRIKLQSGLFIVQYPKDNKLVAPISPKDTGEEELNPTYSSVNNTSDLVSKIIPELIIKITDKKKILTELDNLGINRQSLFGDIDSVATVIREKYF